MCVTTFFLPAAAAEPPSSSSDLLDRVADLEAKLKKLENGKKVAADMLDEAKKDVGRLRESFRKEKHMRWQTSLLLLRAAKYDVARLKASGQSLKTIAAEIKGVAAGDDDLVAGMDRIIRAASRASLPEGEVEAAREEVELLAGQLSGGAPSCAQPNAYIYAAAFKGLFY